MALPNSLDSTAPAGSASPSLGDDQFRAKTLAILDILGIPDATSITQAAFDIDAGGLAQVIFYDAATTPASGELGRNGSPLYYRIQDSRTATVLRALGIIADTSGTPAAGLGTGILFQAESEDEAPSDVGGLDFVFSDVGTGSEDSYLSIALRVAGGALDEKYRLTSTAGSGFTAIFAHAVTADRTYTLPDETGTIALGATPTAGAVTRTAGDVTTTSTSLVDLTGATVTITTAARRVHFGSSLTTFNSSTGVNEFNVDVDGTLQFGTTGQRTATSLGGNHAPTLTGLTGVLTAASHTIKIQWKVTSNTGTVEADTVTSMHFYAFETGATA